MSLDLSTLKLSLYISMKVDENDTEQIKNTVQIHNDFLSHLVATRRLGVLNIVVKPEK
jgi:hypothetical protein